MDMKWNRYMSNANISMVYEWYMYNSNSMTNIDKYERNVIRAMNDMKVYQDK